MNPKDSVFKAEVELYRMESDIWNFEQERTKLMLF